MLSGFSERAIFQSMAGVALCRTFRDICNFTNFKGGLRSFTNLQMGFVKMSFSNVDTPL
jgi:hypothetical protein